MTTVPSLPWTQETSLQGQLNMIPNGVWPDSGCHKCVLQSAVHGEGNEGQ